MKCPIDGSHLHVAERNGVEIDYCPTCRGVWLDRGELDKIIERSSDMSPRYDQSPRRNDHDRTHDRDRDRDRGYRDGGKQSRGRKMGGFLEDIFDF
jgi:Zn-finger nucleic acid-binding protein